MQEAARALLQANTETVEFEGRVWRYSVPSKRSYPHQWLWDSGFHAVVWSLVDPARGCDELRSLFRWQAPNGFIPHVVFWHSERFYLPHLAVPRERRLLELPSPPPATDNGLHPAAGAGDGGRAPGSGRRRGFPVRSAARAGALLPLPRPRARSRPGRADLDRRPVRDRPGLTARPTTGRSAPARAPRSRSSPTRAASR